MSNTNVTIWDRLVTVQNRISLVYMVPVDILTITGFMNDREKLAHCERYEAAYPAK